MGGPDNSHKAPKTSDFTYPLVSFVEQYFRAKGLFVGKEPLAEFPFPIECLDDVLENGEGETYIGRRPVEGVHTRVFSEKFIIGCSLLEENDDGKAVFVFNETEAMRLMKIYIKKVGGMKPGKSWKEIPALDWAKYYADINDGMDCIMAKLLAGMNPRNFSSLEKFGGELPSLCTNWEYSYDTSQKEKLILPISFKPIFDKLKDNLSLNTPLIVVPAFKITKLIETLEKLDNEMPEGDPLKNSITDLKSMVVTAKNKNIGIYIRGISNI
jgi:hypothetical protein